MGLPSGYTQLEYIGLSGSQYIDTGFKPNNNTRVVMDFYMKNDSKATQYIFGARTNTSTQRYDFLWSSSASSYTSLIYNGNAVNYKLEGVEANGRHFVEKDKTTTTLDGVSVTSDNTNAFTAAYTMYIGTCNNAGSALAGLTGSVYYCTIYDNGTLIRDFVPCKNASGVVGMYDTVNNVFYGNSGSGAFTAGPEIAGETPETYIGYVNIGGVLKPVTRGYMNTGGVVEML